MDIRRLFNPAVYRRPRCGQSADLPLVILRYKDIFISVSGHRGHTRAMLSFDTAIAALKAAGEGTRLRVLSLLGQGELTVKDLTAILGQSQPRISRHLKLLTDAGLVDRHPEGAWVFYRLAEDAPARQVVRSLVVAVAAGATLLSASRDL